MKRVAGGGKSKDWVDARRLDPKSLHRKKKGFLWVVESRLNGKRSRKYFRDGEAEARDEFVREMQAKIDALAREDRGILADQKLLEEAARGQKALALHGKSITNAIDFYLEHLEAVAKRDATPVGAVIGDFLDEKEREGVSLRHYQDLKNRLSRFEKDFTGQPLSTIGRNEINSWLQKLPLAGQTKNNFRRVLSNLFSYALRAGIVPANPVLATSTVKVRRAKTEILAVDEVTALLECCGDDVLPSLVLMVFCGIRQNELYRLDWRDIDWEDKTVEVSGQNAKREAHARHVKIPDNAVNWLKPHAKRRGRLAPWSSIDKFKRAQADARVRAGWKAGEWPSNALRKTFISCHFETFGSVDETAKEAGTSPAMIHKHYRKLIKQKEAKRLWEIWPDKNSEGKVFAL